MANAKLVESERRECQNRVKAAPEMLKSKTAFTAKEAKAIAGSQLAVQNRLKKVKDNNSELTAAPAPQHRANGWTKALEAALSEKRMAPLIANRAREVKLGSTVIRHTRRMEEYEARMEELVKEAKTRVA